MKLNIYKDELFTEVREVREVPRIKIPYSASRYVLKAISELDLEKGGKELENNALRLVLKSEEHLTAIVQATFAVSDEDLPFVDTMELGDVAKDIIQWVLDKISALGIDLGSMENDSPNP